MKLEESTFEFFAAKAYDAKTTSGIEEFNEDMKRFQYLKRLFRKFKDKDELNTRLILNHIIILYNCLGPAATILLFYKLSDYKEYLTTFLIFINQMPDIIRFDDVVIRASDITLNKRIIEELRNLK